MGTRTLLYGVHQFLLHPFFVLLAWLRLYGWPKWWELISIIVHDWGYWGCKSLEGSDGLGHPIRGSIIAYKLVYLLSRNHDLATKAFYLVLGHSRHFSEFYSFNISKLCYADKLAVTYYPMWIYLLLARLTGEIREYRLDSHEHYIRTCEGIPITGSDKEWFIWIRTYMKGLVYDIPRH